MDSICDMTKTVRDSITCLTLNGADLESNWKPKMQFIKVFKPPSEKPQKTVIEIAIARLN